MKSEAGVNTIAAGSGLPPAAPKSPLQGTVVAGSWASGLDSAKTMFDPTGARAALGRTVVMSSTVPRALPESVHARAALSRTILLRPAPRAPDTSKERAEPVPASRVLDVNILENVQGTPRYRDLLSRHDEQAFLLMTDFAETQQIPHEILTRWQRIVRAAVAAGESPASVLALLNRELCRAGLEAAGICARLDVRARSVVVASAGGPAPFILHAHERIYRMRSSASDVLGRLPSARFCEHALPFNHGETLLVPSVAWVSPLERACARPSDTRRILTFARRTRSARPVGGSLLVLHMR